MPAKNAPSANDTSNSCAAPKATPSAIASTHSVNNSREPVPATRSRIHGITRRPTTSITAMKAPTFSSVQRQRRPAMRADGRASPLALPSPSAPATAGSSTSASTIARSSTISQPIAILPRRVSSRRRSSSARSTTTVLATDSARPNTRPLRRRPAQQPGQRRSRAAVTKAICASAPGMAMAFTAIRSRSEKCRPTPNISRITPISASCGASVWSATKPGRERAGDDARDQVAHQRRQPQALREQAEHEGQHEAHAQQGDQRGVVGHRDSRRGLRMSVMLAHRRGGSRARLRRETRSCRLFFWRRSTKKQP